MKFHRNKRAKLFETAAVSHLGEVYRFARQLADDQRAHDLVQETYLRAWKYFDSFQPGTNCRSWLFRILYNVWRDGVRQPRLEIPLTDIEQTAIEPYYDWEPEFFRDEFSTDLEAALSQVPETYRWAILLADVEELSYQEIANVMDCPIGTVMSRINRGRRALGRLLRQPNESTTVSPDAVAKKFTRWK